MDGIVFHSHNLTCCITTERIIAGEKFCTFMSCGVGEEVKIPMLHIQSVGV